MKAGALFLVAWLAGGAAVAGGALTADERAALAYLEGVTCALDPARDAVTWDVGGSQSGVFAKRYQIAFAGYAAATLALRDEAVRPRVARILGWCVERMLKKDVWAYAGRARYWGGAPWFPDPCRRENVMYTGHLLQLLALYETFSGDRRYREAGFDFAWGEGRAPVHYTTGRLVEVTVGQMRENESGGVTCEPGLLFFPCNNHPHLALKLLERLGYGDFSAERRKWETWALGHFPRPFFGGGAFKLVQHRPTGLFFPRGNSGLDGWSLLWYQPWAGDPALVARLWREASARIDWKDLASRADEHDERLDCRDPARVPPVAVASFLAAAARACGDAETAGRLERLVDGAFLRREGDSWHLACDRRWRIGCTANRIIALACANGADWRAFVMEGRVPHAPPEVSCRTP